MYSTKMVFDDKPTTVLSLERAPFLEEFLHTTTLKSHRSLAMMNDTVLHNSEHAGATRTRCTRSGQGQLVGA